MYHPYQMDCSSFSILVIRSHSAQLFGGTQIFTWNCYQIQLFSCLAFRGMLILYTLCVNVWCVERLLSRENPFCCISMDFHPFFMGYESAWRMNQKLAKMYRCVFCVTCDPWFFFFLFLPSRWPCQVSFFLSFSLSQVFFSSAYHVSLSICNQKHFFFLCV